jgi:glutathione synthase/RimK-type ligase-like ATP-grasp enzyme
MAFTYSVRILLTDGAGLTSRQVATQLDHLNHHVTAAVSDPICMARFTRHVRTLHRVPDFGSDPLTWFDRMLDGATSSQIDVVFPTQEQVTVLSHQLPRLIDAGLATAVPPFSSLAQIQDKLSALRTLESLGVPQPRTLVVENASHAAGWSSWPAYVKAPLGTGSTGVTRVND